jgi:hypothetical protein
MELSEKLAAALDGEDLDDVIPALSMLLAQAGAMACNDKDVFSGYVLQVITSVYDAQDSINNSIQ